MPANVESAVYANTPAWHREGVVLDTEGALGIDVETAIVESGLDWTVSKRPVFASVDDTLVAIPRQYAIQRDTDDQVLGVVGEAYNPVQNHEGFKLLEDLLQQNEIFIEAAGALGHGERVWILAHCPQDLQIAGEDYAQYILFANGFDGRLAVTATLTPTRVVCQNTLNFALGTSPRVVRIRHTTNAVQRLEQVKHLLSLRDLLGDELARQGEWLVQQELSDAEFSKFLESLYPIHEEQQGKPAATMAQVRRNGVADIFHHAPNLEPIRSTRWAAAQAVLEYRQYGRPFRTAGAQFRNQVADDKVASQAFAILSDKRLQPVG